MSKESWYTGCKPKDIIRIDISEDFIVDYDKARGMYRVSVFDDGHFWDEFWFDCYEEKEVEKIYLVYGNIDESGDIDSWVEAIFDNKEQALACAEYLNLIKNEENVSYYASGYAWHLNKLDYVEELKKLKDGK